MKTMHITSLGEARHASPVSFSVGDDVFIPADVQWPGGKVPDDLMLFEKAGPRKKLFFDPAVCSEEAAVEKLKEALKDMPKEHALIAGMFISGLLRCNMAQQIQQQYMRATAEGGHEP